MERLFTLPRIVNYQVITIVEVTTIVEVPSPLADQTTSRMVGEECECEQ